MSERTGTPFIFHSIVFSPMNFFLTLGVVALDWASVAAAAVIAPLPPRAAYAAFGLPVLIGAALLPVAFIFRRLEVRYDGRAVILAYGFTRVAIPRTSIANVEITDIRWFRFGGTGIRLGRGVRAWITGSGPGVKFVTTRGITYFANCTDAPRLARLVEKYGAGF
jgi:hypothetical protein